MSNSPLVCYTRISPHKTSPRNHKIDKITIHHMAGNLTIETCGNVFQSRQASSNYGIGTDGRVGMYVEEKDRSWASSNAANDHRAVTIEVANSSTGGNWPVSDQAMKSLIDLCVDICKRNGIPKLNFTGDKTGNLTQHNYFAATACPGPYLKSKFQYIADEVNKRLEAKDIPSSGPVTAPTLGTLYRVQSGAFKMRTGAEKRMAELQAAGFDTYLVKVDDLYKVQTGAFSNKAGAQTRLAEVKAAGFSAFITTKGGAAVAPTTTKEIKEGSVVRVKQGAKTYTGGSLASFVYDRNHIAEEINGDRVVITYNGTVVAAVRLDDLTMV